MAQFRLLDKEDRVMRIECTPDGKLLLVANFLVEQTENSNTRVYKSIPFSEFSETLTSIEELKRLVVNANYSPTG